jgi:hypothetical protein
VKESFYSTPFFLSLTIGVPFCIYKILFGILATRIGETTDNLVLVVAGGAVICWAAADLIMNLIRAFLDLFGLEDRIEYCTLAQAGRLIQAPLVFLAIDTLLTFGIICFVLWSGWIVHLTTVESYFWYFSTTLNLISLSLVGLWTEILRYHRSLSEEK